MDLDSSHSYNVHRAHLNSASGLRADIDQQPGCMISP